MTIDFRTALREAGLARLCAHYSLPATAFDPSTVRICFRGEAGEYLGYDDYDHDVALSVEARLLEPVIVTVGSRGAPLPEGRTLRRGALVTLEDDSWNGRSLEDLFEE